MDTPRDAVIAVTYRCNARCEMCNIWKETEHDEMEPFEYLKLPTSIKTINITGGEPFLRDDLANVLKALHSRVPSARFVFSTNGLLTERIISKIDEIRSFHPRLGVGVSIDGLRDTHDEIRGVDGMFDAALSTVDGLKRIGVNDLRIGMTILPSNLDQVSQVYDLSSRLGIQLTMTNAHNSEVYFGKTDNEQVSKDNKTAPTLDPVVACLLRSRHPKDWFRAYHTAGISDYSIRDSFKGHCEAGKKYFFMTPSGDVYPCNVLDKKIGNLREVVSWGDLFPEDLRAEVLETVGRCRQDCWMVCNTRSLIRAHPVKVGRWIAANKLKVHFGRGSAGRMDSE
jgi:radical SAM protein with 4Fe4S-binding SPASM domain